MHQISRMQYFSTCWNVFFWTSKMYFTPLHFNISPLLSISPLLVHGLHPIIFTTGLPTPGWAAHTVLGRFAVLIAKCICHNCKKDLSQTPKCICSKWKIIPIKVTTATRLRVAPTVLGRGAVNFISWLCVYNLHCHRPPHGPSHFSQRSNTC